MIIFMKSQNIGDMRNDSVCMVFFPSRYHKDFPLSKSGCTRNIVGYLDENLDIQPNKLCDSNHELLKLLIAKTPLKFREARDSILCCHRQ